MPSQTGYFDTLKSVAGKVFTYLASITLTGTDGKILTVNKTMTLTGPDDTSVITFPAGTKTIPPTTDVIIGDGTAGRVLRRIYLLIQNGTDAATIKPSTVSRWNGDANAAADNLGKGGSVAPWALTAAGGTLSLQTGGISGDPIAVLATIEYNASGTAITVNSYITGTTMAFAFYNAATGAVVDLTTLVDTGVIQLGVLYLTSA